MLGLLRGWLDFKLAKRFFTGLIVLLAVLGIYTWRLGTLTPGLSPAESIARTASVSSKLIYDDPVNAPHKLLQFIFQSLGHHGAFWMRLSSVLLALIFLGCFFYLARVWFGLTVGVLATLLFAATPWLMTLARTATPDILLLSPLAVIASYVWLTRSEGRSWPWLVLVFSVAASLYVPGLIWLVSLGVIILRRQLTAVMEALSRWAIVAGVVICLLIISPLIWAIIRDWAIIKPLLLVPAVWPSLLGICKSIVWTALSLVWRLRRQLDTVVGRLAILDIIQIVLVVFGSFALWRHARRVVYGLLAVFIFGVAAAGLNDNLSFITLALPAVGLAAAAGLRYLYMEWRGVFPFNPIPRALALTLMVCLVGIHIVYGIRYSLVAWPRTIETRHVYVIK